MVKYSIPIFKIDLKSFRIIKIEQSHIEQIM